MGSTGNQHGDGECAYLLAGKKRRLDGTGAHSLCSPLEAQALRSACGPRRGSYICAGAWGLRSTTREQSEGKVQKHAGSKQAIPVPARPGVCSRDRRDKSLILGGRIGSIAHMRQLLAEDRVMSAPSCDFVSIAGTNSRYCLLADSRFHISLRPVPELRDVIPQTPMGPDSLQEMLF